jgi:subtilisin family serine protease
MICGKISVAATVDRLKNAVNSLVAEGVQIIQISLEFPEPARRAFEALSVALLRAASKGILVVIPVGNLAILDSNFILASDGVIPVAMSDWNGLPHANATLDPAAARRGLLALGVDIPGALSPEGYTRRSGTSYAAAFVTGTLALLDTADSRLATVKFRDAFLSRIAVSAHTNRMVPSPLDLDSLLELKT